MAKVDRIKHQGERPETPRPRGRMADVSWLLLAGLALGGIAGYLLFDSGPASVAGQADFRLCASAGQRNCVVDGDTIRYGGMIIRIEDIDTPETYKSKCASEAALGRRATLRLLELLNEGPFDLVYTGGRDEDKYGRKLRVIARDGRSLGGILVAEGLARPWEGRRRSWCG